MDGERFDELTRMMRGLAGGDRAMVIALHTSFGPELTGVVRLAAHDLRLRPLPPEEVAGLVLDLCFELEAVARGWDPSFGVAPWVWARHRVDNLVRRHTGPFSAPFDDDDDVAERAAPSAPADSRPCTTVLEGLAGSRPELAVFRDAVHRALPPGDVELFLAHAEQVAGGDPAPAVTVSTLVGRSPAAVRKAVERGRRRLTHLAEREAGFRPLLDLPVLRPGCQRAAA